MFDVCKNNVPSAEEDGAGVGGVGVRAGTEDARGEEDVVDGEAVAENGATHRGGTLGAGGAHDRVEQVAALGVRWKV